jgi:hypothetical protein
LCGLVEIPGEEIFDFPQKVEPPPQQPQPGISTCRRCLVVLPDLAWNCVAEKIIAWGILAPEEKKSTWYYNAQTVPNCPVRAKPAIIRAEAIRPRIIAGYLYLSTFT